MKAKNTSRQWLRFLKRIIRLICRIFDSGYRVSSKRKAAIIKLQEAKAESVRIAQKLCDIERSVERSKIENRALAIKHLKDHDIRSGTNKGILVFGWKADKRDKDDEPGKNLQCNIDAEDNKENLQALFSSDHDAAQFEQYLLENNSRINKKPRRKRNR